MTVDCGKNHYRIVPVEGTDGIYTVTKNNRQVKRITHDELFINGDLIDIENWFNIA